MSNTLEQYRQAKSDIQKLHGAAKKELIGRFNGLASELLQIQKELRDEFGVKLNIPSRPKGRAAKAASPAPSKTSEKHTASSPAITAIEKRLDSQKRKLDEASKAGKPDKAIRDRIYELEDELRLAKDKL